MARVRYMTKADLPPRPDNESGEPAPPHAPGFMGLKEWQDADPYKENDLSSAPAPPTGQGPVRAWSRTSKKGSRLAVYVCSVMLVVPLIIRNGISWFIEVKYWPVWLLLSAVLIGVYFSERSSSLAAGVDWVAKGSRWVSTYELTSVKCYTLGQFGSKVRLRDAASRKVWIGIPTLLFSNQTVWDLVYNGMIHSIISGNAETNSLARGTLRLPIPMVDSTGGSKS